MHKLRGFADLGPAIVVAVVAFGPGSILIATQVGATLGPWALLAVLAATVLMIGAAALAMRVGALLKESPCQEIRLRLGTFPAIGVGLIVFGIVAIFQSSNNFAVIASIEALVPMRAPAVDVRATDEPDENAVASMTPAKSDADEGGITSSLGAKWAILLAANAATLVCLFATQRVYAAVERLMKLLMFAMVLAFATNFVVALVVAARPVDADAPDAVVADAGSPQADPAPPAKRNWIPLLGLIGTTYSVAGAYYQAYLVRERSWGPDDLARGLFDSLVGGIALGLVTALMLMTGVLAFFGKVPAEQLASMQVIDIAAAFEPLFGDGARLVFGIGLMAATFCSFLVNCMAGGTILADSLGWGSRISERGPKALTAAALLIGMVIAMVGYASTNSTTGLIYLAQALTVIGLPALAAALLYLGLQRRPDGEGRATTPTLTIFAVLGLLLSCVLAGKLAYDVAIKLL